MRRLLALMIVVSCAAPVVAQDAWHTLKSDTGTFEAQFPSKPQPLTRKVKTPDGGELLVYLWLSIDKANKRIFIASYGEHAKAAEPNEFLQRSMKGNMAAHKGVTKQTEKAIKLDDKHPGLDYTFAGTVNGKKRFGHTQVFLVDGKKVYQMIVISTDEDAPAETVQKFFKSFKMK